MNKPAVVLSGSVIICTLIICLTYIADRYPTAYRGTVFVKGMAQVHFDSDLIVWEGDFTNGSLHLKDAYTAIAKDKAIVHDFLISNGIEEASIIFGPISTTKDFETIYSDDGDVIGSKFLGYVLKQQVKIESADVGQVEKVSRSVTEVMNKNVQLYSCAPRFYYSMLADLKQELISKAAEDARIRAENIAENTGAILGDLVSGEMGVFQIVGQNSGEDYSWGGTFNTSAKKKTASITMKLKYRVEND